MTALTHFALEHVSGGDDPGSLGSDDDAFTSVDAVVPTPPIGEVADVPEPVPVVVSDAGLDHVDGIGSELGSSHDGEAPVAPPGNDGVEIRYVGDAGSREDGDMQDPTSTTSTASPAAPVVDDAPFAPRHDTGVRTDWFGQTRDVDLDVYENGAIIARERGSGEAIDWTAPSPYDSHGALKDRDTVERESHWWTDLRLQQGINTAGPQGWEHTPLWRALGSPNEVKLWSAQHDVQMDVAYRDALRDVELNPGAAQAEAIMGNYRVARDESVVAGYGALLIESAEGGHAAGKSVMERYGFSVPGASSEWRERYGVQSRK